MHLNINNKKVRIVEDRWEFIEKYVRNKTVLDVGCAELIATTKNSTKKERWPFEKIKKIAKDIVGLDINKEQVEMLQKSGHNVVLGNAEKVNLRQTFDVILAGELIEHLSNPGLFLENMKRHLNKEGVLIITTPNRFNSFEFFRTFIANKIPQYTKEIASHVFYFDINSLRALTERHNFQVVDYSYYWTFGRHYDSFRRRVILKIIVKLRPQFVRGIIMVFKKGKHGL